MSDDTNKKAQDAATQPVKKPLPAVEGVEEVNGSDLDDAAGGCDCSVSCSRSTAAI
jgi:hypothetical protein